MMVGSNLKDTQLQQIVDKTILFADKDGTGKINFEEFCEVVGNTDVHKKMVVDVQSICKQTAPPKVNKTPTTTHQYKTNKQTKFFKGQKVTKIGLNFECLLKQRNTNKLSQAAIVIMR